MALKSGLIAAIDLGSTKVSAVIARVEADQNLKIIGVGQQLSRGLRTGTIVGMESLEVSILNAVNSAEEMAGETVQDVLLSLSTGFTSQIGEVEIPLQGREVQDADLVKLLDTTKQSLGVQQSRMGQNSELIHAFPIYYTVDGNKGIRDPRGMYCQELGMSLHVVTLPITHHRNFSYCLGRCHLALDDLVASPYASALSTLVEDEMDLGVTLVDMGGNTTSYAVFADGHCVRIGSINLGGHHITNDIAQGLSTPIAQAERLKTLYGSALPTYSDEREMILVPQIGDDQHAHAMQVTRSSLVRIIRPRVEEILELLKADLDNSPIFKAATRRIVLTGGASQLSGIRDLTAQILNRQVRLGKPLHVRGLSEIASGPGFSSVLGLLNFGLRRYRQKGNSEKAPSFFRQRLNFLLQKRYR
jgi:cell division protein FtsA